jgi:hypothetical protein
VSERLRIVIARLVRKAGELARELEPAEAQRADAAPADSEPAHLLPLGLQLALQRERATEYLRVEGPGKTAVAHQRDDRDRLLVLARLEERQSAYGRARPRRPRHQLEHAVGIRAHRLDARLGPLQLGGGNQLEGACDLARVAHRADAPLDVLYRGH